MIVASILLAAQVLAIDPVSMRWTLGAHEPFPMYRRMGAKSTGGIEGSAKWLKSWLDWWDENAPTRMEEFGLNALHSRFYKGMGWEVEKKDFPNVKRFVSNCHRHGVTALAYVQFATLYYEPMSGEIPNVREWAAVDAQGEPYTWGGYYCRWVPCVNNEEWAAYIERVCEIALTEGGFDGIMFDNCFSYACYCPRCEKKFNAYMQSLPDKEERFGYDCLAGVRQPRRRLADAVADETARIARRMLGRPPAPRKDVKDPVEQEWLSWRVRNQNSVLARFRRKIKSVKPDAIVSANPYPFCGVMWSASEDSVEMISLSEQLDLLMLQSDNFPEARTNGVIRNRVRDLKLSAAVGKPCVALCDANSGQYHIDESAYLRPLVEDLVWGGVPTDRTVMNPVRTPTFIDEARFAERRRLMSAFNAYASANRAILTAPSYQPVRIFYAGETAMFSVSARDGVTAVEEICLRNHIPFGYALARGAAAPDIPADCEVLVVADQRWLSDAQVDSIAAWAKSGGKLVVTGESGLWDERGCQRFENPLEKAVAGLANVSWRKKADTVVNSMGWTYTVFRPDDGGAAFIADLGKVGFRPEVSFENLPETVFAEVKRLADGYAVHLVNYNPKTPAVGVKVVCKGMAASREPFGRDASEKPVGVDGLLPEFVQYAVIKIVGGR